MSNKGSSTSYCGKELGSSCNTVVPNFDKFQKLIDKKCNVNNFPIDTHKDFKCTWEHAFKQGRQAPIESHPDYKRLMEKYAIKGKCGFLSCQDILNHPQYEKERKKWQEEWKARPITEHPGYLNLMREYAIEIKGKGNGKCDSFIPCKDITQHPEYEKEKKRLMSEWCKIPITRHPDYRKEVERLLKQLLSKLGQSGSCQIGGGEFDALVNLYGGAPDVTSKFKSTASDKELKDMYQDIVTGRSKPCPPPPIENHPDYKKLVQTITNKVKREFGVPDKDCPGGVKKCSEKIQEVRKEESQKCQDRVKSLETRYQKEVKTIESKSQNIQNKLKESEQKSKVEKEERERLRQKLESKIKEDAYKCTQESQKLKKEIERARQAAKKEIEKAQQCSKKEIEQAKQAAKKCESRPVTEHPDYAEAVKREQKKLLKMIKDEQSKCQSGGKKKLHWSWGEGGSRPLRYVIP